MLACVEGVGCCVVVDVVLVLVDTLRVEEVLEIVLVEMVPRVLVDVCVVDVRIDFV